MKIQKQVVSKKGDKIYYKNVIILSPELLKEAGFKEGDELEAEAEKNKIMLKKR